MKILAIGAHYDDVEIGCGGTLARHAAEGASTVVWVATHSGYEDRQGRVVRAPEVAQQEGRAAADILGVARLMGGDGPTNDLRLDGRLVAQLREIVEVEQVDALYVHWPGDVHLDHRNLGLAALSAARHVPRVLLYRSNDHDSGEAFRGAHYVDVSDAMETKIKALEAHRSEHARSGPEWIDRVVGRDRVHGRRVGVRYAECFEAVRYRI